MSTVSVYLDDGRVYEYDVADGTKGREHASAIVGGGYRHTADSVMEHYPPHRILKVKVTDVDTSYPDRARGT